MIFIDAIKVKVRDGQVTNRPVYVVIGVTVDGERDILGLWAGDGGEGAKFWLAGADRDEEPRGRRRVIAVCDGLKGLPEAITTVWDRTVVQTCVIHLLRNTFRYASRKYWDEMARTCGRSTPPPPRRPRPAVRRVRRQVGRPVPGDRQAVAQRLEEFVPFLDYDVEIRKVICSHERHRVDQRPLPPRGAGPRALPDRAGRAEVPVPGDPVAGPHREGPGTMGDQVEAGPQRVRHHLRRPHHPERGLTMPRPDPPLIPVSDWLVRRARSTCLLPSWLLSVVRPAGLKDRPAWLERSVASPLTGMCPPTDPVLPHVDGRRHGPWSRLGIDAHKRTHTVVAVDEHGRQLGDDARSAPRQQIISACCAGPTVRRRQRLWAVEDCRHLSRRLERDLLAAGERIVRVPPKLMANVRDSARTYGKSDPIDALAVARAALREPDLPTARLDGPDRRSGCWSTTAKTWWPNAPGSSTGCAGTCTNSTRAGSPRRVAGSAQRLRRDRRSA